MSKIIRSGRQEVEIACEVRRETERAFLIFDGKAEVWIPKSQITDQGEDSQGRITSIFVSEWLATEKGLI